MSRDSFFSNLPTDNSLQTTPKMDSSHVHMSHQSTPTGQVQAHETSSHKPKRITYSIKIDPTIRKSIKDWAQQHDVTISSVIETLARLHLNDLSVKDIRQ